MKKKVNCQNFISIWQEFYDYYGNTYNIVVNCLGGIIMRYNIGTKILIGGMLLVLFFTGINVYTYFQIQQLETGYIKVIEENMPRLATLKSIESAINFQNSEIQSYILTGDQKYADSFGDYKAKVFIAITELGDNMTTDEERAQITKIKDSLMRFQSWSGAIIVSRRHLDAAAAADFLNKSRADIEEINKGMSVLSKTIADENDAVVQQNKQKALIMKNTILILDSIVFVFAIAGALLLSRRISRPLKDLSAAVRLVAAGNLSSNSIAYNGNNEIGDLSRDFSVMAQNLRELIQQLKKTAEQVASSSEQLNASAEQSSQGAGQVAGTVSVVAEGTTKQVEAIKQAEGAVKEMVDAIGHISDNATNVSTQSDETAKDAVGGSQAVKEAVDQMQVINSSVKRSAGVVVKLGESSKQIGEIVEVISNIAGQTNLLALNAAIEAARAGEQGRGFAVVAEEVRKLAEQSEEATSKISAIIKEIQGETNSVVEIMEHGTLEVDRGTEIITATGERFEHIVVLVQDLNAKIQNIGAASQQLSASSNAVVKSVDSVRQIAGDNSANTETISAVAEQQSASMQEIAASSNALANMASELQNMVQKFKL